MVFFKIRLWNKLPVKFEVKNKILVIHHPSHSEVVDMVTLLLMVLGRVYLSLMSPMVETGTDQPVSLK